jgi:hypothetical protein
LAILGAFAIASSDAPEGSPAVEFFEEIFGPLMEFARNSGDLLSYCSFQLLERVIYRFRVGKAEVMNGTVLNCIASSLGRPTAVVRSACQVLNALCRLSDPEKETDFVGLYFEQVFEFCSGLMANGGDLIADGVSTMSFLISCMPKSRFGIAYPIVESVEMTWSKASSIANEEGLYGIGVGICDLMTALAFRIKQQIEPFADRIMQLLFRLINGKRNSIFEESLIAISGIIRGIREKFAVYLPQVMDLLWEMLETQNPDVILAAVVAIADLFSNVGSDLMAPYLERVYDVCVPMVFDDGFSRNFGARILNYLSEVTYDAAGKASVSRRDEIYGLTLRFVRELETGDKSEEAVEHGKGVFSSSLNSLRNILDKGDSEFLSSIDIRDIYGVLDRFADAGLFYLETLLPFYSLLTTVAHAFGGRVILALYRKKIRDIIKFGVNHQDSRISRNAKNLEAFLINYK